MISNASIYTALPAGKFITTGQYWFSLRNHFHRVFADLEVP